MRRRSCLLLLVLIGGMLTPIAAFADEAPKLARIGYIGPGSQSGDWVGSLPVLRAALAERGYVDGRNVAFEVRYAEGDPGRLPQLIAELLALKVDVLVTPGAAATREATRQTATVPIVSVSGDPVAAGFAASLARPGANVTGLSMLSGQYSVKWLELLKEAVPGLRHVAVLVYRGNPLTINEFALMERTAPSLGLELAAFAASPTKIESTLDAIARARPDGLVVTSDPYFDVTGRQLAAFAAKQHLPTIYGILTAPHSALMSYTANPVKLWRSAADYIDRILKGARPAEMPIGQATDFVFRVNLKTANSLGLVIPSAPLARADEVTE